LFSARSARFKKFLLFSSLRQRRKPRAPTTSQVTSALRGSPRIQLWWRLTRPDPTDSALPARYAPPNELGSTPFRLVRHALLKRRIRLDLTGKPASIKTLADI